MLRKIIPALCMLLVAAMFSCNDSESVSPKEDVVAVSPPPRTINVNARLEQCLISQTADVYVRLNSGSWTLINSVPSTSCDYIGSFSASDGDVVEFMVLDAANPLWTAEYRANAGFKCPSSGTRYCGDGTAGTVFSSTLVSTVSVYSIQVSYDYIQNPQPSPCKNLLIC